jgi:hypothetical protein
MRSDRRTRAASNGDDPMARGARSSNGDPWRDAPTSELGDQVLPRWFVLTAIASVLIAIIVLFAAFALPRRDAVTVEARRPPASDTYTNAVGEVQTGGTPPQPYDAPCDLLQGVQIAGSAADRAQLRQGLAGLCNIDLPDDVAGDIRAFAEQAGTVRFATFEATGVDSTASRDTSATIFINARFQRTDPLWIAPLVVHDAVLRRGEAASAERALLARRAEATTCDRLLGQADRSRGCQDAAAVLDLDDPLAALRGAGFE